MDCWFLWADSKEVLHQVRYASSSLLAAWLWSNLQLSAVEFGQGKVELRQKSLKSRGIKKRQQKTNLDGWILLSEFPWHPRQGTTSWMFFIWNEKDAKGSPFTVYGNRPRTCSSTCQSKQYLKMRTLSCWQEAIPKRPPPFGNLTHLGNAQKKENFDPQNLEGV